MVMVAREPMHDPNVAAFLVVHGGMRLVVEPAPPKVSPWWRSLFGAMVTSIEPEPARPIQPNECWREGTTIRAGSKFAEKMEFYMNDFRIRAREHIDGVVPWLL